MPIKPLKIALVGTCCSGKTTIFEGLRRAHRDNSKIIFVTEAARKVFAVNPALQKDHFSLNAQRAVQRQAIKSEKKALRKKPEVIICDRSVVDSIVYLHSTGRKDEVDILFEEMAHWIPSYDRFILFDPRDIPYSQDEIRNEPPEKRLALHTAYQEFFAAKKIPYSLLSGSQATRLRKIKKIIGSLFILS